MPTLVRDEASSFLNAEPLMVRSRMDVVCLSHLRWDFVFQRPQHLLTRAAIGGRVFYIEEPIFESVDAAFLQLRTVDGGVVIGQPVLPHAGQQGSHLDAVRAQRKLVEQLVRDEVLQDFVLWVYTPMALAYADTLQPAAVVYDCMDELSAFRGAPPALLGYEQQLLECADVVFTGGASLFEGKRHRHPNVYLFASSVDVPHFAQAREAQEEPADQAGIAHPRVGFYGVLDERMDWPLLQRLAELKPDMQFVMLGPLTKIDVDELPQAKNLHYLGAKSYAELPQYLAGWDAAMLPFALNEATRFISPTKTPEYLAAHKRVVSTAIRDVVTPYGDSGLVAIARTPEEFVNALDAAILPADPAWTVKVDAALSEMSWDRTWDGMRKEVVTVLERASAAT